MDRQEGSGKLKRLAWVSAGVGLFTLLGLAGCRNHYPESAKYPVRADPLILKFADLTKPKLTWLEPDRPGQLPIYSLKDIADDRNPMYLPDDPDGAKRAADDVFRDVMTIPAEQRDMVGHGLNALFGTPAQPKVQVDEDLVSALQVDMPILKEGSRLYRIHCVHCHGVPGDGRGATARWINPHPRDFRLGIFKFQSIKGQGKPRREDLYRVIENGLEGTAMPSFVLLKKEEIDAMVSYVIHLSIRGQTELEVLKKFNVQNGALVSPHTAEHAADKKKLQDLIFKDLEEFAGAVARLWSLTHPGDAGIAISVPANPYPGDEKDAAKQQEHFKSLLRGKLLFLGGKGKVVQAAKTDKEGKEIKAKDGKPLLEEMVEDSAKDVTVRVSLELAKKVNCAECHTDYGRRAEYRWDEWGTEVKPRNFTDGIFRGGRRVRDIYYRIHSGIPGSGMNGYSPTLSDEQLWDMVNFVRALGYPRMREALGID